MIQTYLAVMAGGACGSGARMFMSLWVARHFGEAFPWGTVIVNISGCFIIGLFNGLTTPDGMLLVSPLTRQFVMIGILGGYTTFSSFSLQTISLLADGEWLYAFGNVTLSVFLCLIGTWAGMMLAGLLQSR